MTKQVSSLMVSIFLCLWAAGLMGCTEAVSSVSPLPVSVSVVKVVQQDVVVGKDWVGTTAGSVNAVIRAQVDGYLLKRHYIEGAFVRRGEVLFEIDGRKFKAALDQAQGALEKARAQYVKSALDVKRDTPLAKAGAVSQKQLDDSIQANLAARASVASAKASVEQAELNLLFSKVLAPMDGIVGIAKAQIGDLVGSNDELASMSNLDPIRVYFSFSEQEYLQAADKVREGYAEGPENQPATLDLILTDGTVYPHKGKFLLVDRHVDTKTGTIRVAAVFPNPDNHLRPGQFARVRATKTKQAVLLVPQRAVTDSQGVYQVAVLTPHNRVEIRQVRVAERVGSSWIIDQGVSVGELVIAEGLHKAKAGMTVTPKSFSLEQEAKKL